MSYGRARRPRLLGAYPRGLGESFLDASARIADQWAGLKARLPNASSHEALSGLGIDLTGILNAINGVVNGAANVAAGVTQVIGAASGSTLPQSQWKPLIDSWYTAAMRGDRNAATNLASYDFGDAAANAYRTVKNVEYEGRVAAGQLGVGLIGQSNLPGVFASPLVLAGGAVVLYLLLRRR